MVVSSSRVMLLHANQCCWAFSMQGAFLSASWPQLPVFLPSENREHLPVFCSSNCSSTMLIVLAPSTLCEEGRKSFSFHCWHCPSVFSPVGLFLPSTSFTREENYRSPTIFFQGKTIFFLFHLSQAPLNPCKAGSAHCLCSSHEALSAVALSLLYSEALL